jgi:hypothetical protein
MSVSWLTPAAWSGLAVLAVPILIHLLARERSRRLWFPSLRFLRTTRLVALKTRRISDWPLFAIRLLILASAVAALAAPVFVSNARWRSWSARTARAVVVAPTPTGAPRIAPEVRALVQDARVGAFVSEVFEPNETIAEGLRDAADWLERQPPSLREVVVIGDLRVGAMTASDVDLLTSATGIRLLPLASFEPIRDVSLQAIADTGRGATVSQALRLTLTEQTTTVERRSSEATGPTIKVIAASRDQRRAEAALRAVLAEGIVLPRDSDRQIVVEFNGAPNTRPLVQPAPDMWMRQALERLPGLDGGVRDGQFVVRTSFPASDPDVAAALSRILRAAFADDLRDLEPSRIPARLLAAWSRPAGGVPGDAKPRDEGDRRYFWSAAVALLMLEQWIRRRRTATPGALAAVDQEVRVA